MSERIIISRKFLLEKVREFHPKVLVLSKEFQSAVKNTVLQLFDANESDLYLYDTSHINNFVVGFCVTVKRHWRESKRNFKTCITNHPDFYNAKVKKSDVLNLHTKFQEQSVPSLTSKPPTSYATYAASAVGRLARARARARTAGLHHLPTDLKLILFEGK